MSDMTDASERRADVEMERHHVNDDPRDMTDAKYLRWSFYICRDKETRARMFAIADRLDTMDCGHPGVCRVDGKEGTSHCRWCEDLGRVLAQVVQAETQ